MNDKCLGIKIWESKIPDDGTAREASSDEPCSGVYSRRDSYSQLLGACTVEILQGA